MIMGVENLILQMKNTVLAYSPDQLAHVAAHALKFAQQCGATQAAVEVSEGSGLSVSVRHGEVETLEHTRDKGMGITVYTGKAGAFSRGSASTGDFGFKALEDTVRAACDIARFTAADDCAGLPDANLLATPKRDLKLFHPWTITAQEAIKTAVRMEQAAYATDKRIQNIDGCGLSVSHGQFVLANSHGFSAGYPFSRHSLSIAPIAGSTEAMQRDDWYSSSRNAKNLAPPEAIGRYAAQRTLARLDARCLSTRKCPVLFEAPLACGLLGSFVQAASGGALYRDASFLKGKLGKQIFSKHLSIEEDPFIEGEVGSAEFDDEAVSTRARQVVQAGVLQGYFLSSYTARKLKMVTTGNAGGSHNLTLHSRLTQPQDDFKAMLRKLNTGLLVTETLGQGVNYINGDYSRGASGYWVENGVIAYPVEEITMAGNLAQMFKQIVAVGADQIRRGSKVSGSILIDEMMVAGK